MDGNDLRELLQCIFCRTISAEAIHLPCFHLTCLRCLKRLHRQGNRDDDGDTSCPRCELPFEIDRLLFDASRGREDRFIKQLVLGLTKDFEARHVCVVCDSVGEQNAPPVDQTLGNNSSKENDLKDPHSDYQSIESSGDKCEIPASECQATTTPSIASKEQSDGDSSKKLSHQEPTPATLSKTFKAATHQPMGEQAPPTESEQDSQTLLVSPDALEFIGQSTAAPPLGTELNTEPRMLPAFKSALCQSAVAPPLGEFTCESEQLSDSPAKTKSPNQSAVALPLPVESTSGSEQLLDYQNETGSQSHPLEELKPESESLPNSHSSELFKSEYHTIMDSSLETIMLSNSLNLSESDGQIVSVFSDIIKTPIIYVDP